jgi:lipopolysaccharide biosynthesis glycosyltransferase
MNICLCFGPNWLQYIPVQLDSLFRHNKVDKVYLMSEKLTEDNLTEVKELCARNAVTLKYIDMKPFEQAHIKSNKNVDDRFTKYTLYRLVVPDFVPEDRVLYLDADTLVVGDISEFYNTDLGNNLVAGCIDTGITLQHKRKIGGSPAADYLNAGVLLMNLAKLRQMEITKKWLMMMNKTHYPAHDQDIIFLTLTGRFKVVEPIYNCSLSTKYDMPNEEVRIVHYAGDKRRNWVYGLPKAELWVEAENKYRGVVPSSGPQRINKIIAYGWFGGGKKPPKVEHCINSWKRVCPDWEILELNETNCDVNKIQFVADAYRDKKYAFVADYFRMEAMYERGCVTLDADVELLKPLDDFLHHRMFSGQEVNDEVLITATMGAEKGHPVVKQLMDFYLTEKYVKGYRTPNTRWITEIFKGLIERKENQSLILKDGVHLYPSYYFCSYDHKRFEVIPDIRSYSIHWFNNSWGNPRK